LTFDDVKHRYTLDGESAPGVTTFIKGGFPEGEQLASWKVGQGSQFMAGWFKEAWKEEEYPSDEKVKAAIKLSKTAWKGEAQKAANVGTIVHDYAYLTELGKRREALLLLEEYTDTPQWEKINNGAKRFDEWKDQNDDTIVAAEAIVASPQFKYAGKFDRLASRGNRLVLSDFKTSSYIYVDQFIQLAAYAIAIEDWLNLEVQQFEILRFGKEDGAFQTLSITDSTEMEEFRTQAIRCRQTYEFRKWENDSRFKFGGKK
jgi:hypothetical protein